MHAEYTPTIDELIEARILGRARAGGAITHGGSGRLVSSVTAGLAAAAIARPGWIWSAVICAATAVTVAVLYRRLAAPLARRALRRDITRQYGRTPSAVELDITGQGLWIARDGVQTLYEWPFIRGVDFENGQLQFSLRDEEMIIVPRRACPTWDEVAEWIQTCRGFAAEALQNGESSSIAA